MSLPATLASVPKRDKILSFVQFVPMMCNAPLSTLGLKALADSTLKLSSIIDKYRAISRFSGIVDVLGSGQLETLAQQSSSVTQKLSIVETISTLFFFVNENLAVLSGAGVINPKAPERFGGLAVFFWLWSLLLSLVRLTIQFVSIRERIDQSRKRNESPGKQLQGEARATLIALLKTFCFTLFAMSVLPAKGKPQLLTKPSGVFLPIHRLIELLAPTRLALSTTAQGFLGTVASICDVV